jgi:excinuclease ABC subunit C
MLPSRVAEHQSQRACAILPGMTGLDVARGSCDLLPARPGVYRFRDHRGVAMYIGRATNLRTRTASYWGTLKGRGHLRRMVPQIGAVEALVCASVHEATWLERNLLERGLLRWNRARGGQEVPVWLALDPAPRAPALRLAHAADPSVMNLGPFLGADRARLVRSGLSRVWPVAATGVGLTGAEREIAASRGVGPADRERFVASIVDALAARDPAVGRWRSGLLEARDRAVEGLAFELARLITDELDVIDWATGTQRVTTTDPVRADVHGWHDGVLVSMEIRAGRMERWHQRLVDREPATTLEATPPQWREFADENARLAARLLGRTAPASLVP